MSDLGTLVETCVAETQQPGEEPAFRRHIVAALKHYRPYRFLFSEKSVQFTLIPQQDEYKPGGETIVTPGYTYLTFPDVSDPSFAVVNFGSVFNVPNAASYAVGGRYRSTFTDPGAIHLIAKSGESAAGGNLFAVTLDNNGVGNFQVAFGINGGIGQIAVVQSVPPWNDGEWHKTAGILRVAEPGQPDIYQLWLYHDGTMYGPVDANVAGLANSELPFFFGAGFNDQIEEWGNQFVGDLERVVAWNKSINISDIDLMMNWEAGEEIPSSVASFWPLLAGEGSFIEDYVGAPATPGPDFVQAASGTAENPRNGTASTLVGWGDDSEVLDYDFPGDIMELDEVRRQIGTRSSVPLRPVTIGELRELQASGLAYGQPDYYCWHHDRFIVWPRPSAAHVLTLDYHVDATRDENTGQAITPSSEGTATNEYFRRGEELMRSRALATFALGRDDDYELAKRMKILNQEAERSLYKERDIMKVDGFQAGFHF